MGKCEISEIKLFSLQKGKRDTTNFDADFTKEEPQLTPTAADVIRSINQDEFRDFDFINPHFQL